MFEGQPKGLFALALANTGERFGYYTMLAAFVLFMQDNFLMDGAEAGSYYSNFLMFVYFLPLVGGILADKLGYGKMVTIGITIMFLGYLLLSIPMGNGDAALWAVVGALGLISLGTGLFKGNLQVMVGNLYDDPKYANKRDAAFSLFYMAINIGALFAPTAAIKIMEYGQNALNMTKADSYHLAFGVACVSLIISMVIYFACRPMFKHVEGNTPKKDDKKAEAAPVEELTPSETKARVIALCLVFAVVIFFWMAFHQNGLTLTYFANEFTEKSTTGFLGTLFNVWNLVAVIIAVYAGFSLFQSKTAKAKAISGAIVVAVLVFLGWQYYQTSADVVAVDAKYFQTFNPFYVVALTPVSMAVFSYLASKGKEPSAPRKIAYGMLIAAVGFIVMAYGSMSLLSPTAQATAGADATFVSPSLLINTYLVLTFAELFLSPMGISFVSKVAPPKLKGLMMGGWFVATALGNKLTEVGSAFWGDLPLVYVWGIFVVLCLISALFMFVMMKRLEKVA